MAQDFTAHNIRLDDGSETAPHIGWLLADRPWLSAARRVLKLAFPTGLAGRRIVDLGCLEDGYTVEFARRGMGAPGIEARASNYGQRALVRSGLFLVTPGFVRDAVWDITKYGNFDAVFVVGAISSGSSS